MNDELQRYLDGETGREDLEDAALAEAQSWERLLTAFRTARPSTPAPPWLEDRVMAAIGALPERGPLGRLWGWLMRPRTVRVSPAVAGLAAAVVVALLIVSRSGLQRPGSPAAGAGSSVVYVQFSLVAPDARSVAVGGDFDEWRGSYALEDRNGDGIWTGRVPVRPGVHTYMFLINGSRWVTDPEAASYVDDGFGNKDAVLAVPGPVT